MEAVSRENCKEAPGKEEDFHPTQISSYLMTAQMYLD